MLRRVAFHGSFPFLHRSCAQRRRRTEKGKYVPPLHRKSPSISLLFPMQDQK